MCCSSLNLYFLSFSSIKKRRPKLFFTWLFPYFGDRELYLVGGCLHHAPHTGLVGQTDGGTGGVFKHRDKTLGQDGLAVTQFCPDLDLHFLKNPSHTKYFILWNTNRFINILYAKFTCRSNLKIIKLCPICNHQFDRLLSCQHEVVTGLTLVLGPLVMWTHPLHGRSWMILYTVGLGLIHTVTVSLW